MMKAQDLRGLVQPPAITDLVAALEQLPPGERARFDRLLHVSESTGLLVPPDAMRPWIESLFGSVAAVEEQKIVKITNLVTFEGTLFNALRSSRPMPTSAGDGLDEIASSNEGDPFCRPEHGTPEDIFGRIEGSHAITASNVAKYDAFHGVVIYDNHNPLQFSRDAIVDYLEVGLRWGEAALEADPAARYFFFMWNCLWKSGASILHGHAQVAATRDMHYAKVEHLRRAALAYRAGCGANFFQDLYAAHAVVGLTLERSGVHLMASLTPIKEKEVWLFAENVGPDLGEGIYRVLDCYVNQLGVASFNVVLYLPPLAPVAEDWSGFPVIARIVDRGQLRNRTADMGAMELYASSVVSSDPFKLMDYLRGTFV
ncbi:MAG TPA: hypothetical protein VII06_00850 [Chloroflexota bacterium]